MAIRDEATLMERLTRPSEALVKFVSTLEDDLVILGAGGKVGTTLAVLARRALDEAGSDLDVVAVSRFSGDEGRKREALERQNIRTVAADLGDEAVLRDLPDYRNILYLVGRKFGTQGAESTTWDINVSVPSLVTRRFKGARFVVFSTGNVYPFVPAQSGGCTEDVPPSPVGEYAMSCLGRERIFEHAAAAYGSKVTIFRLNFAIDLRYGVLNDIAQQIMAGTPVNLTVPNFNCIWQGYVAEVAIRSLGDASEEPFILNVTGPEILSTRRVAEELAVALDRPVTFGEEGTVSLLSHAGLCMQRYGYPEVSAREMIKLQAEWIRAGGEDIGAPTHFEVNRGNF